MKRLLALLAAAHFAAAFAASPAATQSWVRNYVATNSSGDSVSAQWVRDYVATASVTVATSAKVSYSKETADGAVNLARTARLSAIAAATNDAWVVGTVHDSSLSTNIAGAVLAPTSHLYQVWGNAPLDVSLGIEATVVNAYLNYQGVLFYRALDVNTSAMRLFASDGQQGSITDTNRYVDVYRTMVTEAEIKAAKGEN